MSRSHRMLKTLAFAVLVILALAGVATAQQLSVSPTSPTFAAQQSSTSAQSGGFVASPSSLTSRGTAGGANPEAQTFSLTSYTALILQVYYAAATTSSGGNWLSVAPPSGFTPHTLTVTVNAQGLAPGTYFGQISVTAPNVAPATVQVTLTVGGSGGTGLTVSPATLALSAAVGGQSAVQTVSVYATTQTYYYATVQSGSSWLILTQSSGTTPGSITLYAKAAGLTAGTYYGCVGVTSSLGAQTVTVTLTVNPAPAIPVSPGQLNFTYQVGGSLLPAQFVRYRYAFSMRSSDSSCTAGREYAVGWISLDDTL